MPALEKVFVYGTLKRGEPNHNWLTKARNGTSRMLSKGTTVEKYPLVIATKYNIPFLIDAPTIGHNVEGEVYEVDNEMLKNLDILEDHPIFYTRRKEPIIMEKGNSEALCWTYFLAQFKPDILKNEMFASYSSMGPHKLVYCERDLRDPSYCYKEDIMRAKNSCDVFVEHPTSHKVSSELPTDH